MKDKNGIDIIVTCSSCKKSTVDGKRWIDLNESTLVTYEYFGYRIKWDYCGLCAKEEAKTIREYEI